MSFPSQFQALRLARHLTTAEAAAVYGPTLSARTVEGWEQGRNTKEWMHAPLLEYFERHAPQRPAPKPPARKRRKA
jgi:DNA-binding transcriptional regulator YiaG